MRERTAIVLGGSIAGLWTARVLSEFFDRVIVIERDELPEEPDYRPGVPQSRQYHIMLIRGLQIMDELFPTLRAELMQMGAIKFDFLRDVKTKTRGEWLPQFESGKMMLSFRRVLLEYAMRGQVRDKFGVEFMQSTIVSGLVTDESRQKVIGVKTQSRHQSRDDSADENPIYADFVVDATGRASSADEWLTQLGFPSPPCTTIDPFLGYVTRRYQPPENWQVNWKMMLITAHAPHQPYGALIFPEEDGQWCVMMGGVNKNYPPTDDEGFLDCAKKIDPEFYEAVKAATPVTQAYGYRKTDNHRRHYEKMDRWLENFIVVGDAACAFDPIYGQGMSVSGMTALALREGLKKSNGNLTGFAHQFQREVARIVEPVWLLATGADLEWEGTEGGSDTEGMLQSLIRWYFERVQRTVPYDNSVRLAFADVLNLVQPAPSLLAPSIALRVLTHTLKSAF